MRLLLLGLFFRPHFGQSSVAHSLEDEADRSAAAHSVNAPPALQSIYEPSKPRHLTADDIAEVAKLTASDGAAGDEFGVSVAVDNDIAVVGAQGQGGGTGN